MITFLKKLLQAIGLILFALAVFAGIALLFFWLVYQLGLLRINY